MDTPKPSLSFSLLFDSPNGWGPGTVEEQGVAIPFAPFSKNSYVGRVADWAGQTNYANRQYNQRWQQQQGPQQQQQQPGGVGSAGFGYHHVEDDDSFQVVDQKSTYRPKAFVRRTPFQQRMPQQRRDVERGKERMKRRDFNSKRGVQRDYQRRRDYNDNRAPSVQVQPDWKLEASIPFSTLTKLPVAKDTPEVKDLKFAGSVRSYEKSFDRINCRSEKSLSKPDERIQFCDVSTTDDPIMTDLIAKGAGQVFATDTILAHLMSCTRSVNSWDVIALRVGDLLFFDKRDDPSFDLWTVNETASNPPPSDAADLVNSAQALSREATLINQVFCQQTADTSAEVAFEEPNPFFESEDSSIVGGSGYRYRQWKLDDSVTLVSRCTLDAVSKEKKDSFYTVKALNECTAYGGMDWRKNLDNQRGAVLATELKNNSFKLGMWTCLSLLNGSDQLKLGYVSRVNQNDPRRHTILGVQSYKPVDFARQINLYVPNMWAALKHIIDLCMNLEEGKYLIMRDATLHQLKVYSVPMDTFEEAQDDEEGEEGEDGEGEEGEEPEVEESK